MKFNKYLTFLIIILLGLSVTYSYTATFNIAGIISDANYEYNGVPINLALSDVSVYFETDDSSGANACTLLTNNRAYSDSNGYYSLSNDLSSNNEDCSFKLVFYKNGYVKSVDYVKFYISQYSGGTIRFNNHDKKLNESVKLILKYPDGSYVTSGTITGGDASYYNVVRDVTNGIVYLPLQSGSNYIGYSQNQNQPINNPNSMSIYVPDGITSQKEVEMIITKRANVTASFELNKDTITLGDNVKVSLSFTNGDRNTQSAVCSYSINLTDKNTGEVIISNEYNTPEIIGGATITGIGVNQFITPPRIGDYNVVLSLTCKDTFTNTITYSSILGEAAKSLSVMPFKIELIEPSKNSFNITDTVPIKVKISDANGNVLTNGIEVFAKLPSGDFFKLNNIGGGYYEGSYVTSIKDYSWDLVIKVREILYGISYEEKVKTITLNKILIMSTIEPKDKVFNRGDSFKFIFSVKYPNGESVSNSNNLIKDILRTGITCFDPQYNISKELWESDCAISTDSSNEATLYLRYRIHDNEGTLTQKFAVSDKYNVSIVEPSSSISRGDNANIVVNVTDVNGRLVSGAKVKYKDEFGNEKRMTEMESKPGFYNATERIDYLSNSNWNLYVSATKNGNSGSISKVVSLKAINLIIDKISPQENIIYNRGEKVDFEFKIKYPDNTIVSSGDVFLDLNGQNIKLSYDSSSSTWKNSTTLGENSPIDKEVCGVKAFDNAPGAENSGRYEFNLLVSDQYNINLISPIKYGNYSTGQKILFKIKVNDQSGDKVIGANVKILSEEGNVITELTDEGNGNYSKYVDAKEILEVIRSIGFSKPELTKLKVVASKSGNSRSGSVIFYLKERPSITANLESDLPNPFFVNSGQSFNLSLKLVNSGRLSAQNITIKVNSTELNYDFNTKVNKLLGEGGELVINLPKVYVPSITSTKFDISVEYNDSLAKDVKYTYFNSKELIIQSQAILYNNINGAGITASKNFISSNDNSTITISVYKQGTASVENLNVVWKVKKGSTCAGEDVTPKFKINSVSKIPNILVDTTLASEVVNVSTNIADDSIYTICAEVSGRDKNDLHEVKTSFSYNIIVDKTYPQIIINSPLNNSILNTSKIVIDFSVIEENLGDDPTFEINPSITCVVQSNYIRSCVASEGTYEWNVSAKDKAGNTFSTGKLVFSVDTTPPTITITSPTEGSILGPSVFYNITTSEEATCTYEISNANTHETYKKGDMSTENGINQSVIINFDLNKGLSGYYVLNATCFDLAGNSNQSQFTKIELDADGPKIVLLSPSNMQSVSVGSSINVIAGAGKDISGNCSVYLDNVFLGNIEYNATTGQCAGHVSIPIFYGATALKVFSVKAFDSIGNPNSDSVTLSVVGLPYPSGGGGGGSSGGRTSFIPPANVSFTNGSLDMKIDKNSISLLSNETAEFKITVKNIGTSSVKGIRAEVQNFDGKWDVDSGSIDLAPNNSAVFTIRLYPEKLKGVINSKIFVGNTDINKVFDISLTVTSIEDLIGRVEAKDICDNATLYLNKLIEEGKLSASERDKLSLDLADGKIALEKDDYNSAKQLCSKVLSYEPSKTSLAGITGFFVNIGNVFSSGWIWLLIIIIIVAIVYFGRHFIFNFLSKLIEIKEEKKEETTLESNQKENLSNNTGSKDTENKSDEATLDIEWKQ